MTQQYLIHPSFLLKTTNNEPATGEPQFIINLSSIRNPETTVGRIVDIIEKGFQSIPTAFYNTFTGPARPLLSLHTLVNQWNEALISFEYALLQTRNINNDIDADETQQLYTNHATTAINRSVIGPNGHIDSLAVWYIILSSARAGDTISKLLDCCGICVEEIQHKQTNTSLRTVTRTPSNTCKPYKHLTQDIVLCSSKTTYKIVFLVTIPSQTTQFKSNPLAMLKIVVANTMDQVLKWVNEFPKPRQWTSCILPLYVYDTKLNYVRFINKPWKIVYYPWRPSDVEYDLPIDTNPDPPNSSKYTIKPSTHRFKPY